MRRLSRLSLALCLIAALSAAQPAAAPVSLKGKIDTPLQLLRLVAIDRAWADVLVTSQLTSTPDPKLKDDFIYEAHLAPDRSFHIDNLLPNRQYDLIVWTKDAAGVETRWEGAGMDYHRDIKPSTPATADDRKAIETAITEPAQFYDKVRTVRIAADHQHATVLVELLRTRDFHADKGGEVIYRVELWYFENLFGGWAKDRNTERVLARLRGKPASLPANYQFEPALGGITPAATPLTLKLPDTPSPKHGIAGGIH